MKSLNLALIQTHLHWHDPDANRAVFSKYIKALPHNVNLVILPEMWTTGFTMTPESVAESINGDSVQWMQQTAQTHNLAVCGSLAIKENNTFYNRFIFAHPNGTLNTYDKAHPYTPSGETEVYQAGKAPTHIEYEGVRIRPLVCYDLRFPVFARNTDNYDLIICVANWPSARIQAWNALLRARAIENMAYCVGVNRIGKDAYRLQYPGASAAYNALGDELVFMESNQEVDTVTLNLEELHMLRKKHPFLEDRDEFTLT